MIKTNSNHLNMDILVCSTKYYMSVDIIDDLKIPTIYTVSEKVKTEVRQNISFYRYTDNRFVYYFLTYNMYTQSLYFNSNHLKSRKWFFTY